MANMIIDELNIKIAVIGLGYVGLPLTVELGKIYDVVGFDLNQLRVDELRVNFDRTGETDPADLIGIDSKKFTSDERDLSDVNFFIVCVPTPIDDDKRPNLEPLKSASEIVSRHMKAGAIVVYESTVYPGLTEEFCAPILELGSGLKFNDEFFCGYSPERINPGDKTRTLTNIVKITSGSTLESARFIDAIYKTIIKAGTYLASSIKVAEAAKVIENIQRDVNIALINELSIIFSKLEINTEEVLKAAGTKWNFVPFTPGLVGGHCIGVDPYYLTAKALDVGYNPAIILAGRKLNDEMGAYVARRLIEGMSDRNMVIEGANILVLGITFKENCADIRNSKVTDIIDELIFAKCNVDVYDPFVSSNLGLETKASFVDIDHVHSHYDAIVIAVAHDEFKQMGLNSIRRLGKEGSILYDLKWIFNVSETQMRL